MEKQSMLPCDIVHNDLDTYIDNLQKIEKKLGEKNCKTVVPLIRVGIQETREKVHCFWYILYQEEVFPIIHNIYIPFNIISKRVFTPSDTKKQETA